VAVSCKYGDEPSGSGATELELSPKHEAGVMSTRPREEPDDCVRRRQFIDRCNE
jgi:hypothetical protein